MQYELCPHGKCTTYPGWHKCEKCEEYLIKLLRKTKKGTHLYHALRYAVGRMSD